MNQPSVINCVGSDESMPYGFDPAKAALVIIDMQPYQIGESILTNHIESFMPGFKNYVRDHLQKSVIPNMNRLIQFARKNQMPIVATRYLSQTTDDSDLPKPCQEINKFSLQAYGKRMIPQKGDPDAEITSDLNLIGEDLITDKSGSSIFTGNDLHQSLQSRGIDHLILTGVITNCCVSSTARQAWDWGYYVTVISDACAGFSQKWHDIELESLGLGYSRNLSCNRFFAHIEHAA